MQFSLKFQPPQSANKIDHTKKVLMLGSCFSDEILFHMKRNGFHTSSNPLGTIFHPIVLSRFINELIFGVHEERIIERDNLFFSWDASSVIYGNSREEVCRKLKEIRTDWSGKIKSSDFLIVTFGTSWAYELNSENVVVANCHKLPGSTFKKRLVEGDEMAHYWEKTIHALKEINPGLKIIFTVSPVRHTKDGLVENNRSKAELIRTVHSLTQFENCEYFPSYEIVIDELRDYRFFTKDLVHPNELAIEYVWNKFSEVYFSDNTRSLCSKVLALRNRMAHKTLHPESDNNQAFQKQLISDLEELKSLNPEIYWE